MATALDFLNPIVTTPDEEEAARLKAQTEYLKLGAGDRAVIDAQRSGRALGQAFGTVVGADTRTPAEKSRYAIARVQDKIKAAGIDPDDPTTIDNFYKQSISALQQEGLAPAALAVAKEYEQRTLARREQGRKDVATAAANENAIERNRIALLKLGTGGPKIVQLMNQFDAETDPTRKATIKQAIDNMIAGKGVKAVALGDRVELVDAQTGQTIRTMGVGMTPGAEKKAEAGDQKMSMAFDAARAALQSRYDAAVQLYNMGGLSGITGGIRGPILNSPDMAGHQAALQTLSGDARAAFDLFQRVRATSFIEAFAEIKAQSTSSGSGLGALSDAEGRKLENAKSALGLNQEADAFRRNLAQYINDMKTTAALFDNYRPEGATAGPLQEKALTGGRAAPRRAAPAPAAPAAPAVAPSAPAASEGAGQRTGSGWTSRKL